MSRIYRDEFGAPSPLPVGVESAKHHQAVRYITREPCRECGTFVRYTKNGNCFHCARNAAGDLYSLAVGVMSFIDFPDKLGGGSSTSYPYDARIGVIGNRDVTNEYRDSILEALGILPSPAPMSVDQAVELGVELFVTHSPCNRDGHLGIRTLKGECYFCDLARKTPSPRKLAIEAGKTWYIPSVACKSCGELAEKNVHNGACRGCNPAPAASPRKLAIAAGEATYTPVVPCKICGELAARNVSNGACSGCFDPVGKSPSVQLMEASPDLVISREDASTYGFKVYRTGDPCRRGHKGFRYVSTKNCIDCLKKS